MNKFVKFTVDSLQLTVFSQHLNDSAELKASGEASSLRLTVYSLKFKDKGC